MIIKQYNKHSTNYFLRILKKQDKFIFHHIVVWLNLLCAGNMDYYHRLL